MPVHPFRSVPCRFVDSEREVKFTWAGSGQQSSSFNKQNKSHRMRVLPWGIWDPVEGLWLWHNHMEIIHLFIHSKHVLEPALCQVLFLALGIQACPDLQVVPQVILLINVITRELQGALTRHERKLSLSWDIWDEHLLFLLPILLLLLLLLSLFPLLWWLLLLL